MILVSIPSVGCVDDVVNSRTNYQFVSVIVLHFMKVAVVRWIVRRTKLKGTMKNQDFKGSFFKI